MLLVDLPTELLVIIGSYCAAMNNRNADNLNHLRLTCTYMSKILRSLFLSIYLQEFHVPFTPAGLDRSQNPRFGSFIF
jgi:hypothetical protein